MNEHTPGPWSACGEDRGGCVCGMVWSKSVDAVVATTAPSSEAREMGLPMPDRSAIVANARLIAAAPDLLAALQLFFRNSLRADWPADIYNAAEAAIAKATGEPA